MLEKIERVSYLYDIYGCLLTEKQQKMLKLYYFDNFSLGEIADGSGISRQGVYDLLRRALQSLEGLEEAMNLYERYSYRKARLKEALGILSSTGVSGSDVKTLKSIMAELIEENEA